MAKILINIYNRLFNRKKKRFKKVLIVEGSAATKAQEDTIIIIRKNDSYAWAKLLCPCGCGREIALSLNRNIQPYWTVTINKNDRNKVSFSPSIYLTGSPCKAHFFLKNNRIDWV